MCVAPALLAGIGTAVSTVSTIQQGKAQAASYNNQAAVADQNAKIAGRQAEVAAQNGAEEERQMRRRGAATIGTQKTAFAASGIDSGAGSAVDVINDTSAQNELDALAIRKNAANQVWNNQAEQTNYVNQASAARSAAKNANSSAKMSAFGTLLTGASALQSKYGKAPKPKT